MRNGKIPNNRNVSKGEQEKIGITAEYIAYISLCETYSKDNVTWVSENAKLAGVNTNGTDGDGYDIKYIDKNGHEHLVEVKGTTNIERGIYMSCNEIEVALANPRKYDLLIVHEPMSENPTITYHKSAFKFGKDEDLFKNDKMTIDADSYNLKFNITE